MTFLKSLSEPQKIWDKKNFFCLFTCAELKEHSLNAKTRQKWKLVTLCSQGQQLLLIEIKAAHAAAIGENSIKIKRFVHMAEAKCLAFIVFFMLDTHFLLATFSPHTHK